MDLARIHTAIEEAVSDSVNSIQLPGIVDAAVRNVAVTSQHLQQVATHLERHGQSEIRLSADVELFLRISSSDVLSSIQVAAFRVRVDTATNNLRATASNEENWGMAWERGIPNLTNGKRLNENPSSRKAIRPPYLSLQLLYLQWAILLLVSRPEIKRIYREACHEVPVSKAAVDSVMFSGYFIGDGGNVVCRWGQRRRRQ